MTASDCYIQAPPLLTADEAMLVLRIGRSNVYESANRFLATDGADGIPCVRIGRQLRFPRHALEGIIGGPIPWPLVRTGATDDAVDTDDLAPLDLTDHTAVVTRSEFTSANATHPSDPPNSPPTLFAV